MILTDVIGDTTVETRSMTGDDEFGFPHPGYETTFTGGEWDGDAWRYATEEQAQEQHEAAVAQLSFWHGIVTA